jgi:hypothetical protein
MKVILNYSPLPSGESKFFAKKFFFTQQITSKQYFFILLSKIAICLNTFFAIFSQPGADSINKFWIKFTHSSLS